MALIEALLVWMFLGGLAYHLFAVYLYRRNTEEATKIYLDFAGGIESFILLGPIMFIVVSILILKGDYYD